MIKIDNVVLSLIHGPPAKQSVYSNPSCIQLYRAIGPSEYGQNLDTE